MARAILRLLQDQDKDVIPGRIASSFCLSSTQIRVCSSTPALPLVSPAVGVIWQSGTYWPWESDPTLAPYTSVRAPTSVGRARIFIAIRAMRLSYSRWSSLWQKLEESKAWSLIGCLLSMCRLFSHGVRGTYPGATQFTMTPLELMGDRTATCLTTKIARSFETL